MSPSIVQGPNFFIAVSPGWIVCVSAYSSWKNLPLVGNCAGKTNTEAFATQPVGFNSDSTLGVCYL